MVLVDKDIKKRIDNKELILENYSPDNVNCISYDLTLDTIIDNLGNNNKAYDLKPGEVVFVKTKEKLKLSTDVIGRIEEKNSRMRQGLIVSGPTYQPGHVTFAFLRVQNISQTIIELRSGIKIAQIVFEQLNQIPEVPYNEQDGAAFNNETEYIGLGIYKEEYEKAEKAYIESEKEKIEVLTQNIYANVLTIMGVLVAIFSLITINYDAFVSSKLAGKDIVIMDLTLALCITLMMGIILVFVNKAKNKGFLIAYIAITAIILLLLGLLVLL